MIKASILGILGTYENPLMELTKVKEVKKKVDETRENEIMGQKGGGKMRTT